MRKANKEAKPGLSFSQAIITNMNASGHDSRHVVTYIPHKSGESLAIEGLPVTSSNNSQESMKAAAYAKRGSLMAAFGVTPTNEDNTAWHAGNWDANSSSIGIEHANLTGAPDYDIAQATIDASAKLVADIAQRYGFGRVVPYQNLFPHSSFTSTACPGKLKDKLQEIADKANDIIADGNGNVATQAAQTSQPEQQEVDNRSASIKEFQNKWKKRWAIRGKFTIRTCQKVYGMFQVLTDDLNVEPNSWYYNGIPTGLLEDVSDPEGRSFEDGAAVRFKDGVNSGVISAYDNNDNAVGIYFAGYRDMIWFDADKFLAHP
ncbi:N-acetylmuramoyl-L-alanine amidase [Fructobacillus sp. M1-13]|nr:N-acetylmuramoyl-L-alanine amidase [Fructobacillus papyriferae]